VTAPPVRDWSTPREAGALFLRGRTVRTALPIAAVVGLIAWVLFGRRLQPGPDGDVVF